MFVIDFFVPIEKWDFIKSTILAVWFSGSAELTHHTVSVRDGFISATFVSDCMSDINKVCTIIFGMADSANVSMRCVA